MSMFGTGRREGVCAVLLLAAFAALLHLPGLLGTARRGVLDPPRIGQRDTTELEAATNELTLYPALRAAGAAVADGELPLWNRTARLGEPFSVSGAPLLYPPYWIVWWVDGALGIALLLWLQTAIAAATMYRFLRATPISRYVAFLGGATFALGWLSTAALDRLPEAAAAALLPLVLEQAWRCLTTRQRRLHAPLLGLALAGMFATGGTTTAWLGVVVMGAAFVVGLIAIDATDRPRAYRALGTGAGIALLGTAPLWLGWLELRGHVLEAAASPPHLQVAGLIGLLGPALLGLRDGGGPAVLHAANPGADPLELALYPGALVLFVAVLGLLRPKRTYHGLFWLIVAGVSLVLALDSPIGEVLAAVTGWRPHRAGAILGVVHVAIVMLCALGLDNFFDAPAARRFATPIACGIALAAGLAVAVLGLLFPEPLAALAGALTGEAEPDALAAAARHLAVQLAAPAAGVAAIALCFLLWRRVGIPRFKVLLATCVVTELLVVGWLVTPSRPRGDGTGEPAASGPAARAMAVDRPAFAALTDGDGIVTRASPAIMARTADLFRAIDPGLVRTARRARVAPPLTAEFLGHPLLAMAGVDFAVGSGPFWVDGFAPIGAMPLGETDARGWFVAARTAATERASLAFARVAAGDAASALRLVIEHTGELPGLVVVEEPPTDFAPRAPNGEPSIAWRHAGHGTLSLDVDLSDGRGYLVLADAWAPGWRATVDGEAVPVLPANGALRAVALREGRHRVELRYRPLAAGLGLPLLAAGVLLAAAAWTHAWRTRRRPLL